MRYLNKVIFINSAHVPYAEIKLDGNVHFIGTQGVGKSTLLRAILFFYNVDKSKLGIRTQDKQKSYDEFYLPYPNSYIIYEICRETGKFFVMTFLSRGRTAFRIVDCAYDKRFFVQEDGSVRYEWGKISEAIGTKIFKSNIIRGYEEFRDIIYGNMQQVAKELRRFNILESPKYQNVPRTIQNIFLNQSLESRVIKDTLIDSMDFANDSIDLNFYREHVKDFRRQYEDIWKWYRREKNGKVKVQADAENVISKYRLYEQCSNVITQLCRNLRYALGRDSELLPIKEKEAAICEAECERQKRLLSEEDAKYKSEFAKLNQEEGKLKGFFDKLKEKRDHYTAIEIERIIEQMSREKALKVSQDSLKAQETALIDKNNDVKTKYDQLIQAVENERKEYELEIDKQKNDLDKTANEDISRLHSEHTLKKDAFDLEYQNRLDEVQTDWDNLQKEKAELEKSQLKVSQMNPYQQQMDELERKKTDLKARKAQLLLDVASKQQEMDRIEKDTTLKRKDLEQECDKEIARIASQLTLLQADIAKLDDLLARQKGSLIEWMEENVEGWEDNLGKVLDEDAVLYNTALQPRRESESGTLFGIRIELDNIDRTIRTPEKIKEEKLAKEQEVNELRASQTKRKQQLDADIAELERKPNVQLKNLRKEKMALDTQLSLIPQLEDNCTKAMEVQEENLRQWREGELKKIYDLLAETENKLVKANAQKAQLKKQKKAALADLDKNLEKEKSKIQREVGQKKKELDNSQAEKKQQVKTRKAELQAEMDAEMKGLGVDVKQLENIRKQLEAVGRDLEYIDQHRNYYISWLNDKKDYFDNEQAKKEERKTIKQKIDDLNDKFKNRKAKLTAEINRLSKELQALNEQVRQLNSAIEKVKAFMIAQSCPAELQETEKEETYQPLEKILDGLRDNISDRQRRMEAFKQAVIGFKSNFSPQNTFHFRTEFNTDADYIEFAVELNDFLGNKKIEEYRVRTSEQYASIIRRIAREVSDLNEHNADIKNTIGEINRDFRENNFAGVIKEIELRAVESNDRLMQLLLSIKKFDDDNSFTIGQLNLFTNEESQNRTNQLAVNMLMSLMEQMDAERKRDVVTLADTFKLEFKVRENDNDTNWVEKLSNVGSDGTDILVKAMVNIMLINVFKRKISRKFGDFKLHCMMDEIGKLHPNNVEGILKFANVRNIFLINSSPTTYNASAYRYTYSLSKDEHSNTVVKTLLTIR